MKRATIALVAALGAAAIPGIATADSRLFSIGTDTPGVTVVSASQNGVPLFVAGSSADVTFFRIENPQGPVGCVQGLDIELSDGSAVSRTLDLCTLNWDVTLELAQTTPAFGDLTVTTDDPLARILQVFVDRRPVALLSSSGASVRVAGSALGAGGCERDIGVELADGRRMARQVDVCTGTGTVVIPLIGAGGTPGPTPAPPPVPPLPVTGNLEWFTDVDSAQARLTFGVRASGASEFAAVCARGSSTVAILLTRTTPAVVPGASVVVQFQSGSFSAAYGAIGTEADPATGRSHPSLQLPTGDGFWPALIRGNVMNVTIAGGVPYTLSLKGSAAATRPFLVACNPVQQTPAPPPAQGPIGVISFACNDGSSLGAQFGSTGSGRRVTVFLGQAAPIVLDQAPSQSGARFVGAGAELFGLDESIVWRRPGGIATTCFPR